jgi:hypothetical protein
MAIIPSTTFKTWKDGETVKAKEYVQELEILRTAINANGEALSALQAASAGVLKGVQNGTAFPPNPVAGDMFFRTDEGVLYVLDTNSQWIAQSPKGIVDTHTASKENPHGVSASQVGAYSKAESDGKFLVTSGSNTKGFFAKHPDGTMTCYGSISAIAGTGLKTISGITYPTAFISSPAVNITHRSIAGKFSNHYVLDPTTTAFGIVHQGVSGVDLTGTIFTWNAIGRWK